MPRPPIQRRITFAYDICPTTNATGCVSAPGQLAQATFSSMVCPNDLSFRYRGPKSDT